MGRRGWLVTVLVVVLVAGAGAAWRLSRRDARGAAYRTEALERGDIRVQVSATGTINPVTTVQVGSQVSGTIAALHADFNDRIQAGQVLAQIDPTFLQAQVDQSEADLERARVAVRQAERDYERLAPLQPQGLAPQADVDAAQSALESARASVKAAQAALDRAMTNLRYATIRSPIDGVVISRDVDVGQTVAASLSAPTLFLIAQDLRRMQLEVWVDEADIGRIEIGQPVSFTVDAFPERQFEGRVDEVRLAPRTEQNVVSYTVIVTADNPDLRLLPGMTANATFLVAEVEDVLRAPAAALRFQPEGARRPGGGPGAGRGGPGAGRGGPGAGREGPGTGLEARGALFVLRDGRPTRVRVEVGLSDGMFTAVVADTLVEGMEVIVGATGGAPGSSPAQGAVNPFTPQRRSR